jgi:hypothetical protein
MLPAIACEALVTERSEFSIERDSYLSETRSAGYVFAAPSIGENNKGAVDCRALVCFWEPVTY